jgi:hypothetical protein
MLLLVSVGLLFMNGILQDLIHAGLGPFAIVAVMLSGVAAILGSLLMLTRFWTRLLGAREAEPEKSLPAAPARGGELGPARLEALPDARAGSVTEHTTRTLEHADRVASGRQAAGG